MRTPETKAEWLAWLSGTLTGVALLVAVVVLTWPWSGAVVVLALVGIIMEMRRRVEPDPRWTDDEVRRVEDDLGIERPEDPS